MLLAAAWTGNSAHGDRRWTDYDMVAPDELVLPELSPVGRRVLSKPSDWLIGRSRHFTVFAHARHELQSAVDDAEHALTRAGEWLNLDIEGMPRAYLVFVRDGKLWDRVMKGYGLRMDSLAMQVGQEVYFRDDARDAMKPERVAHEVIQLALNQALAPRIPLWLEEGAACHFGWIAASETHQARGILLSRSHAVFPPDDLFELEELLAKRRYPEDPYRARVFYRQCEELVAVLSERLGAGDFARFLHVMSSARADASPAALAEAAGLASGELEAIVRSVRDRCSRGADGEP